MVKLSIEFNWKLERQRINKWFKHCHSACRDQVFIFSYYKLCLQCCVALKNKVFFKFSKLLSDNQYFFDFRISRCSIGIEDGMID